jgi:hypothetical protein
VRWFGTVAAVGTALLVLGLWALEGGEVVVLRTERAVGLVADTSASRAIRLQCEAS